MKTYTFHFNTKYASELRDAVNDRRKQSIDNVHMEDQTKGQYYAWNRTCAAMDRLEDTIAYLNQLELGKRRNSRAAFDFYDFINNIYIVIDCIKTLGHIFRIDDNLIKEIEDSTAVFGGNSAEKSNDQKCFEYIRSLCSVHPLCTNHQRAFLNNSKFHCCPFVVWSGSFAFTGRYESDLEAWIYTSEKASSYIILPIYIAQFERYLVKWIDLLPKIIEAKNNFTDKEYERLRKEPVNSLSDFSNDVVQYLAYLKQEYCRRFDYGNDYIFDQFIRVFTVNLSDNRNAELLAKYQHAILYSLKFVRNELQNMSYEGYDNSGITYPDFHIETTLFDALSSISIYDSDFSKYAYNLEKLHYLDDDYQDPADKHYARRLLEEPKELINMFVHFTNTEPDEETIVLVNLALYLESLSRKSLLNKNIPNELEYRVKTLSEEEFKGILAEEETTERPEVSIEELLDLIKGYGTEA